MHNAHAMMARPGSTTRHRGSAEPVRHADFPILHPAPAAETAEVIGYGSAEAMESACDARAIWAGWQ